ncbi:hypothetical protein GWK47_002767 [Chionoecetes opilio]|uniref:RFX-type winged-helix domain-containing protein n=1 Tax=Chionoecetes opilio TaxID=41210 RepID=A0A8J5CFJ1_CHIOP|nr:hypothetical protein GWK47_002767 [Chionoecetes opilio]
MRTKRAIRSLNTVPLTYNHQQHNVLESMRASGGMSVDLFRPSLYDKLALSLISPMPNEHDFAFNVCTILSNEGRHVLQLSHCPRLVEHMLGHTGVYRDWETQKFFVTNYKEAKGRSLIQFWIDSVHDRSVLDLLIPSGLDHQSALEGNGELRRYSLVDLSSGAIDNKNLLNLSSDSLELFDSKEDVDEDTCDDTFMGDGCIAGGTALKIAARINSDNFDSIGESDYKRIPPLEVITQALRRDPILRRLEKVLECEGNDLKLGKDDGEIFHLGRNLGSQDPEGTRISQILHVIRNLSFEEHNVAILSRSHTCLKFLVLCICSRWGGLAVNALDTLGNIAPTSDYRNPRLTPAPPSSCPTSATVYDQICRYLTIHDIMLLIYTLECLYSLSSLGTPACNAIVRAKGSIHTLISLLTVEAQSYGPEACIGMKASIVVETVTGVVSEPEPAPPPPATTPATAAVTTVGVAAVTPATPVVAISSPVAVPVTSVGAKTPLVKHVISAPGTPALTSEVPPEVEEFVKEWVTKNYEAAPGNAIEQAIVYRHFAASMQSLGRKQGLNPVLLSNCVRKMFGTGVGPSRRPVDVGSEKWHYNGIRRRDGIVVPPLPDRKRGMRVNNTVPIYTPTPVLPPMNSISAQVTSEGRAVGTIIGSPQLVTTSATPVDAVISPSSPILKAQLSAPLRPSPPPPARPQQGVYSSAHQQHSPQQSQQQAQPANRTDNSALIKSLLANKVTPAGVGQTGSMDPHPSHQTPHSRPLLVPSTPPQQPRGASSAVSYVQALSQGPLGPVGPMLSPTSIGCTSGMQVVSGGVVGGTGGQHGLHQPPQPSSAQVSRNIQKQQQQQQTTDNSQDSSSDSQLRKTTFNGLCNEIKKCEDDSNSLLSSALNERKVTSFEGILQNGIKTEIDIKEEPEQPRAKKNVLADLLEKTVGGDILNGVVERELRISDRSLEFVNNGQQVKINGPVTSNGQALVETGQGIKRPATPDNTPAKRIAIEDPRAGTDSRITLYVSQNGNESGEVISQGHQVVLSQGQQLATKHRRTTANGS